IKNKQRDAHAEEVNQKRVLPVALPEGNRSPGACNEEKRAEQTDFGYQEVTQEPKRRPPLDVQAGAFLEVCDGDPVVLRVPNQHWQRAQGINQQSEIRSWASKLCPSRSPQHEEDRPTKPLKQRDVFAQESQSHPKSGPEPVPG